jgi:transcriptional regulator with XRE-family HTH domain
MPARKQRIRGLPVDKNSFEKARLDRSLTQEELAFGAGVDVKTVQRAETGGQIDKDPLCKLASFLNLHPAQLSPAGAHRLCPDRTAASKKRFTATVKIEGPPELLDILMENEGAQRCFFLLHNLGYIRDGVINMRVEPGCIALIGELTAPDIRRLINGHLRDELKWLNVSEVLVSHIVQLEEVQNHLTRDEIQAFDDAMGELSTEQRSLLLLSQSYSFADVAVILGISAAQVRTRYHRIRARVRASFDKALTTSKRRTPSSTGAEPESRTPVPALSNAKRRLLGLIAK